jgi:Ca-activated chloride channel family protein
MTFDAPERLWLLGAAVVLAGAYVVVQMRRQKTAVKFTNLPLLASVAPKRPGWRRHLSALLFGVAFIALVIGFAKPQSEQRVPRDRSTIVVAIDTSLSMEATDVAPSRLAAAKVAADRFIDQVPPKINVGLVDFHGTTTLRVPPTTDHNVLKQGVDGLALGPSTAIGEAIFTSLDAINAVPPSPDGTKPPARIVLMSDGATNVGRPNDEAAQAAKDADVPVHTIAYGTADGTVDIQGNQIPVPVDAAALQQIADTTGGKFHAAGTEQELTDAYKDIGSSVGYVDQPTEVTAWFVGIALIALVACAATSLVWHQRLP